jgi:hypothetical protein
MLITKPRMAPETWQSTSSLMLRLAKQVASGLLEHTTAWTVASTRHGWTAARMASASLALAPTPERVHAQVQRVEAGAEEVDTEESAANKILFPAAAAAATATAAAARAILVVRSAIHINLQGAHYLALSVMARAKMKQALELERWWCASCTHPMVV